MPSNNSKNKNISAIVLAGGKSTRMGRDKALVEFEGEYMIQRIVRQLREHFDEIIVTTGEIARYEALLENVIKLEDEFKNCGPIGGLYTGLKTACNEYSFVTACDMPFLSSGLVQFLVSHIDGKTDAVVPEIDGIKCVTRAIYGKRCLSGIKKLINEKQFSLQVLADSAKSQTILESVLRSVDLNLISFQAFNTQAEWATIVSS